MMNEQIIQTLLQEASSRILEGVPPQESAAVAAVFERLLRLILERNFSYHLDVSELREMTWDIGRDIIKEVAEVVPEKRLEYIQLKILDQEISDLDGKAQDLAEKSLSTSTADLPTLRVQAKPIQDRIEELYREFKDMDTDWERRYGLALSEASLDCGFVLGEHHFSSMRLGRRIEALKKLGIWPPAWYAELWSGKNVKGK